MAANPREAIAALQRQMETAIVGQRDVIRQMIMGLLANGHLLLESLPGLAKTRAVKSLAKVPARGRVVVSGGELQVELDLARGAVREPLATLFAGRLRDVADLLRRSGVPLLAVDTAGSTAEQVRRLLGRSR